MFGEPSDVCHLSYAFLTPMHTLGINLEPGRAPAVATLFTHCSFNERSGEIWFGFTTEEERLLFRRLMEIQGVGPTSALKILAKARYTVINQLVEAGDRVTFKKLPGMGAKTGDKVIEALFAKAPKQPDIPVAVNEDDLLDEATWKALVALGSCNTAEAKARTKAAMKLKPDGETSDWVKLALKQPR